MEYLKKALIYNANATNNITCILIAYCVWITTMRTTIFQLFMHDWSFNININTFFKIGSLTWVMVQVTWWIQKMKSVWFNLSFWYPTTNPLSLLFYPEKLLHIVSEYLAAVTLISKVKRHKYENFSFENMA